MAELSTKHGIFETGVKDEHGVAYKDGRVVGSYDKHLTEYTVKDGTEVICDRVFYDKKDLRELHLPSSVKAIGESAFAGCKALESVDIPEGVTEIKTATFRDCKSLRRLELPASCTKIAKWAFTDGIETLVCNAPAMQIDKSAFLSCKTLKTVIVPEGCINAYTQAFLPCGFMPQFEEMKEEQIAEEPLYIDDHDEEILDDDIFDNDEDVLEDDTDSIIKDEDDEERTVEAPLENLNIEINNQKRESIMEVNLKYKEGDDGKYGYVDDDGNWAIEPQFDDAWPFIDGVARVKVDGKYGYVRVDGNWAIEPQFDNAGEFSDGLAIVKVDDKYGYVRADGSWALEPQFDDANNFSDGLAIVKVDDKYGYVRADGSWALEPQFDDAYGFSNGLAAVKVDDKYGYVRADGKWAIEPQFDDANNFSDGLAKVEVDGKWGVINVKGKWVLQPEYGRSWDISLDTLISVENDDRKYALFNREGKQLSDFEFENAKELSDGFTLTEVRNDEDRYGLYNSKGERVAEAIYETIHDISDGFFCVKRDGLWGFMRPDGTFLVEPEFDYAWDFEEGKARVNKGLEIGYIDKNRAYTPVTIEKDPELIKLESLLSVYDDNSDWSDINAQLKRTIPYGLVIYSIIPSTAGANPKTADPIWFTWEGDKSNTNYKIGGTKFFYGGEQFLAFQLVDSYDWYRYKNFRYDDEEVEEESGTQLVTTECPYSSRYTYWIHLAYEGNIEATANLIDCYKRGWISRLADIEDGNSDGITLKLDPNVDYSEFAEEWEPEYEDDDWDEEDDYSDDED